MDNTATKNTLTGIGELGIEPKNREKIGQDSGRVVALLMFSGQA